MRMGGVTPKRLRSTRRAFLRTDSPTFLTIYYCAIWRKEGEAVMSFNRRSFIRYASMAGAGQLAGLRPFGVMNGLAESATGYKALVCIFLYGGNDANNTVVPFDGTKSDVTGYANYANIRGPLALPRNSLLQLGTTPYALHPSLPDIRTMYNDGTLAVVANVGTLVQPLTPAEYIAGKMQTPSNLFSHPDQQLEW